MRKIKGNKRNKGKRKKENKIKQKIEGNKERGK